MQGRLAVLCLAAVLSVTTASAQRPRALLHPGSRRATCPPPPGHEPCLCFRNA